MRVGTRWHANALKCVRSDWSVTPIIMLLWDHELVESKREEEMQHVHILTVYKLGVLHLEVVRLKMGVARGSRVMCSI